ncbi:MAG: DNA-binding response OmpR family regulator [Patiriisocius sp.]|jgi:DNA-binding response OmpR family regulator
MYKIKSVLLVEDDMNLGNLLCEFLSVKGYETTLARNGEEGSQLFITNTYDFIILDVMMPKKDGFTLAKEIRVKDKHTPILFLTAKSMKEDTLEGFKVGADDYMTKPFSMDELVARMKAIARRMPTKNDLIGEQTIGSLLYDPIRQFIKTGKELSKLTTKENELLKMLVVNKNKVLDRTDALKKIWGDDSYFNGRSMDVYITKLRKHLKGDDNIEIVNVHGVGFRLQITKKID